MRKHGWFRPHVRGLTAISSTTLREGGGGFVPDFYVDSAAAGGGDGLTDATAFTTLAAAQTAALAFGNNVRIGLKYGSVWRDRLALSTLTGVTVGAYGSPADGLPVVKCVDVLSGTWATSVDRADAYTNVYSRSVSWSGTQGLWLAVWEDEARLAWASSIANCQATPGSFYIATGNTLSAVASSPQTLYVHPKASTNANSDGKVYEFGSRDCAVHVGDDSTVRRIWSQRSPGALGGIVAGKRSLVEDCIGSGGVVHDILVGSGIQRRCIGWIDYIDSRVTPLSLEFYTPTATGLAGLWENCIVVSVGGGNSFGGHGSAGTKYDSWRVVGCSTDKAQIGGADVINVEMERLYLRDSGISITPNGGGVVITDPWIVRTPAAANYSRIQPNGVYPMTIDGMRVFQNTGDGYVINHVAGASLLTITRSVFVDAASATARRYFVAVGNGGQTGVFDGLVFLGTGANSPTKELRAFWDVTGTGITSSNNVFWPDTSDNCEVFNGATAYDRPSLYLAAVQPGKEVGSVVANPQLVDPANGNFTIQASGLPAAGLERDPTCQNYTPIPADLAAAEAWVLGL